VRRLPFLDVKLKLFNPSAQVSLYEIMNAVMSQIYKDYAEMSQKINIKEGKTIRDIVKALYDEVQKSHGNWRK